jgi:hypothetical protein
MLHPSVIWPSADAYQTAMLSPRRFLKDRRLHAAQVESRFFLGACRPNLRSGNFGAVYKFLGARTFALKVFNKSSPDRQLRYRLIDEHLRRQPLGDTLASFRYEEEGILVNRGWYPVLVMDWVPGQPLDLYLQARAGNIDSRSWCRSWSNLILGLKRNGFAHGDLQHGNILVLPQGRFQLVDYDGAFVPAMREHGLAACETGLAGYQHPERPGHRHYFDLRLDDFAALVVLFTFAALRETTWRRYHTDDDFLIVSPRDLRQPDGSALFAETARSPDRGIRALSHLLRTAAREPLDRIPRFAEVVTEPAVAELLGNGRYMPKSISRPSPGVTPKRPGNSAGAAPMTRRTAAAPALPAPGNVWNIHADAVSLQGKVPWWICVCLVVLGLLSWLWR